jgi:hypothetical protein
VRRGPVIIERAITRFHSLGFYKISVVAYLKSKKFLTTNARVVAFSMTLPWRPIVLFCSHSEFSSAFNEQTDTTRTYAFPTKTVFAQKFGTFRGFGHCKSAHGFKTRLTRVPRHSA